ncbi:hypothetical protein WDV06_21065 [Streptomyces racemochromogenes]|uniref:N-acetylmuramoyl-L-alanine amidase n=1 Tax=Streptomyces racemochromogenes TaxID=67353 RepID=A0ABW7PHE6_9ACTN
MALAPARALRSFYAVLPTAALAAPAPDATASAEPPSPRPSSGPGPAGTVAARVPRAPGVRGLEIAVRAYVRAGDPVPAELTATGPAASVVVLDPGHGDAPCDSSWRARADALRAGTTATGELGQVDIGHGDRDPAAVRASVDNHLKTPDGLLHVDGIFFDVVSGDCGPANATRDHDAALRRSVQDTLHAVFDAAGGYRPGAALDPSGTAFWHLVPDVPDATALSAALAAAFAERRPVTRHARATPTTRAVRLPPCPATGGPVSRRR